MCASGGRRFERGEARVGVAPGDDSPELRAKASSLAKELDLPMVELETERYDLILVARFDRLELRETRRGAAGPVYADFVGRRPGAYRRLVGGRGQPLARAVGLPGHTPEVFDATAGLGGDAFRLMSLGCRVTAVERSPVVAALLRDGLRRARRVPQLDELIKERCKMVVGDACELLAQAASGAGPEVVYLDPMFPSSKHASGLVKKEMRVMRMVVGDDADAGRLFEVARRVAGRRVVVKRMRHTARLGPAPDVTYRGKIARYDVYLTQRSQDVDGHAGT